MVGAMGAVGAIGRYAISGFVSRRLGSDFPFGTLAVNTLGCFLIGVLAHVTAVTNSIPEAWRIGLTVGLLGGLTTFSTFGYETVRHLSERNWPVALSNVAASLCIGFAAVWAGLFAARLWLDAAN